MTVTVEPAFIGQTNSVFGTKISARSCVVEMGGWAWKAWPMYR